MNSLKNKMRSFKVGHFLAVRQIKHGNIWISILITTILILTFLSLVVIPGILVGLTEGSIQQQREHLTGDIIMRTLPNDDSIIITQDIIRTLDVIPEVENYSVRYKTGITITSGYIDRADFTEDAESININAYVIDPEMEDLTTNLSESVTEGKMLENTDSGYVLIGSNLLKKYSRFSDMFEPLEYAEVGKPVKLTFQDGGVIESTGKEGVVSSDDKPLAGNTTEFIVKGIVHSKINDISSGVFITEQDYRRITGKRSLQAQEIIITHTENISDDDFKDILYVYGFQDYAKIDTADEAVPKFLSDVQNTFAALGNMVGIVGLVVSSITVFIVIYINALTRRKFIGILKGIGISGSAIEISYLLQSIFYAVIGIGFGLLILYGFLVPFLLKNPIDFPMSDGVLIAEIGPTMLRAGILLVVTMFAGFLPARLIVRQNTLDSILQR